MLAVVAFHGGALRGGFIGVDVFFAISGYLITGLALSEIDASGRLDLVGFWIRRARRLLPALFLVVTTTLAVVFVADQSFDTDIAPSDLSTDVLATIAYVANWTRAFGGDPYFDAYEAPSLLQHTWSLAVEEQFYIVWPLVLLASLAIARRLRTDLRFVIGITAGGFAVASTAWATWLATAGPPFDRLYFGTDTRAVGLAVGCAVACATTCGDRTGARRTPTLLTVGGVISFVVLVLLAVVLDGGERWLYGPGFALVAVASVVVVDAASRSGPIAAVLAVRPLPAIGRVSYGIYLWHWPTIVILDRERTGLDGPAIWLLWSTVTAIATAASWHLVERRVPAPDGRRRVLAYLAAPLLVVAGGAVVDASSGPETESAIEIGPVEIGPADITPADVTPAIGATSTATAPDSTSAAATNSETGPFGGTGPIRILLLGDSVAESLGDAPTMTYGGRPIDALNRGIVACPVHPTGAWKYDNGSLVSDPPECEDENRFDAVVDEFRPHVVIAMFGWPGTIAGRTLDDGRTVVACDPEHDRLWANGFVDLAERYRDRSVVVVPTVAPPQRFIDPEQERRPGCLDDALRSTGIRLVEWSEWLCPDGDCTPAAALRRDPVHFAPDAREVVWTALVRQSLDAAIR